MVDVWGWFFPSTTSKGEARGGEDWYLIMFYNAHEDQEGITDWSEKTVWATQYQLSCKMQ